MKSRRNLTLGLATLMLVTVGCQDKSISANVISGNIISGNTGLGRFVESEIEGPNEDIWGTEMRLRADGGIAFFDLNSLKTFVTKDYGVTWEYEVSSILSIIDSEKEYISGAMLGADGEVIIESMDIATLMNCESDTNVPTTYHYLDSDGSMSSMQFTEWESGCGKMQIADDGIPYIIDSNGEVFKINVESASADMLFATKEYPNAFSICGNYVIAADEANVYIYDLAKGELLENTSVLCDFLLGEGLANEKNSMMYESAHFATSPEGDAIYILVKSGIYRYVLGGTTIEQLVDGNLNSIGDPSNEMISLVSLTDGRFLVQSASGRFFLYTYSSEVESAPSTEIKVYSLYTNESLMQEISDFQHNHPETYITLNVGIPEGSGITYEDALKNLNTEIMSGNAPDIYVMDYLPMESYIEKGVLMDLDELRDAWMPQEDMYENILNTFIGENGMYAVPTRAFIPILLGKQECLDQISDLDSFVAQTEILHEANPDISIMDGRNEEIILRKLLLYAGMDYANIEDMNKEDLVAFLENAKILYDMEMETIPQEIRDVYDHSELYEMYGPCAMENHARSILWSGANMSIGQQQFGLGTLGSVSYAFEAISSVNLQKDGDLGVTFVNGMNGIDKIYIPTVNLGISATTQNLELACEFLSCALSSTTQVVEFSDGVPVNRDAMLNFLTAGKEPGEPRCSYAWDIAGGPTNSFQAYAPTIEENNQLDLMMQSLDTPVLMDEVTKVTILELAPEYMTGSKSAEETADEILEKIALRLSE